MHPPQQQASSSPPKRRRACALVHLRELDASTVIAAPAGTAVCHLHSVGPSREVCPECAGVHLQLVLRQDCVRQAHLFCPACSRMYDARYANGESALVL